jgi:hypothetical protein
MLLTMWRVDHVLELLHSSRVATGHYPSFRKWFGSVLHTHPLSSIRTDNRASPPRTTGVRAELSLLRPNCIVPAQLAAVHGLRSPRETAISNPFTRMREHTCNVLNRCANRIDRTVPCRSFYRGSPEDDAWLAIDHVPPHSRQRQNVVTVIVFASVSMILPVQKGQLVGRETAPSGRDSDILPAYQDSLVARHVGRARL